MDSLHIFLFCLIIFLLVLSMKVLKIFLGLSSSSGHSNVVVGLAVQLLCTRDGDPYCQALPLPTQGQVYPDIDHIIMTLYPLLVDSSVNLLQCLE